MKEISYKISRKDFSSVANMLPGAIAFMGQAFNGFNYDKNASDLSADYGYGRSSTMGIGYTTQNIADSRQVMKEEHASNVNNTLNLIGTGATVGSVLGPIGAVGGAAVGGLVGLFAGGHKHAKAREALEEQRIQTNRYNLFAHNTAMSEGIRQNYMKEYGTPENQVLLTKYGKDAEGITPVLAMPGEIKASKDNVLQQPYVGGASGKDSIPDVVGDGETIFTKALGHANRMINLYTNINKNKGRNLEIAQRAAKGAIQKEKNAQKLERQIGLLPDEQVAHARFGIDNWGNIITTGLGIGSALGQYFQAKNSSVHRPNIMVGDSAGKYVNDLYGLNINMLPIYRGVRDAEARGYAQVNAAGGLTPAQRMLQRTALTANTQNALATSIAQGQDRFNALRSAAASAGLQSTLTTAARNQQALQYNNTAYQQAASARQNIMRDSLAQLPKIVGQGFKNYYDLLMRDRMLDLYQEDIKNRRPS